MSANFQPRAHHDGYAPNMSVERAREQEIGRDMEMTRETRCRIELESVVPQRVGKQRERLHASGEVCLEGFDWELDRDAWSAHARDVRHSISDGKQGRCKDTGGISHVHHEGARWQRVWLTAK